ncbi:MAG TPA: PAS domain S-box protein, partial [Deltaproteobacteria bacterium]|nr:PAS domain S-box protein [Deltaproteobacteria bacterium]
RKDGSIIDIILSSTPIDPTDLSSGTTFSALDITDRKQTENALIESEERYRRITSSISDYIYTVFVENGCTVRTVHSPACEAVTGYTVEEFAADPYLWITMVHEQDRELVSNRASQVLSGIDTGTIEHRIRHRDGSILWISNTPVLHRNPHGELTSYDGVVKDITQRKRSEEALLESEKKYHSLFLNNHAVMLLIDPSSGRIMDANPAACTYYGYTRQELTSKLMSDINTLSPNQVFKKMEMAQTGKTRRFEFHHRLADGDIRDVEVYSGPITIGGEELLYSIIHDITDRKRAQEALKESEDRFRSLIQNSYDIIVILDKTGSFVYETPSVQRVLGYESGYLIGRTPQDLVHPDDLEAIAGALDEVYSDINPGTPTQFRFLRADGSWIYLEAVGKNLLDYPGINGVVITARDITERKKSETNRIDMEKRLLHAQKLESLGVMAGGIAHDFNNLLMAILGNLDLALTDLSPVSRSRRFIDQALLAGRRAADLTNQMLAYSGRGRFDLKSFDISELVEEMARLLKASISKTVTLNLQLKDSLPPIVADPSQIQQIVMNLIVNASEAVGDTAGTVTVSTGVRQCNDEYLMQSRLRQKPEAGRYVFLKVSDTGCGMDQETQERLFDPFFTTKFTGRGLGMAAVLGIVRGHKGAIMVESEPARGTSISILLPAGSGRRQPLGKKPKGRIHTTAEPEQSHRQTRTILIVDDEQMVLDLCSSMVNHFGYTVLTATDGNEAVKIFRRHKKEVDCVILDLTMPKKDGIVAFEELRKIRKDIPVIISSGYDEQEIGRRFQGKGLSGIIKKPYNIEELRKELKRVLRG